MASRLAMIFLLPIALGIGEGTIYVIRHGEKKWTLGCLNNRGQARAQNLINVFSGGNSSEHNTFGVPKAVFAHRYRDPIDCERCQQTVQPLVDVLGITPDYAHGGNHPGTCFCGGNKGAAAAMKDALRKTGGPVLAAWEHVNIQYLTEALGVPKEEVPRWDGSDYDSIYVFEYDNEQHLAAFQHSHQNFAGALLV